MISRDRLEIRLGEYARMAIEVNVIDGRDDDFDPEGYELIRFFYSSSAGKLGIPLDQETALKLGDAITGLANEYDDTLEHGATEERPFARYARNALTSAASRLYAASRKVAA